jgi:hypothetical protein
MYLAAEPGRYRTVKDVAGELLGRSFRSAEQEPNRGQVATTPTFWKLLIDFASNIFEALAMGTGIAVLRTALST